MLTGIVQPGVEPGALLLNGYLLIGGERGLLLAGPVRVTGRPQPDMLTTAQQGTPFVVDEVEAVEPERSPPPEGDGLRGPD